MALKNFRMLNNEVLNKDPYVIPKQAPLVILDKISAVCMAKNGKAPKTPDSFP